MFNGFQKLVDVPLHALLWQVIHPTLDSLVHVHLHELEDEGESAGWIVAKKWPVKKEL